MKLNFSVDEFKDMLNAGKFDEIFFDTLDDLGLKIRNDYYRSKKVFLILKKFIPETAILAFIKI
ncbi:hypothetical protein AKUH3B203J_09380 [Apilactobacillus kunkeei]|nr:hypothetical protein AKUH3B203J_09380 [Apilactobacillus kunkeei]